MYQCCGLYYDMLADGKLILEKIAEYARISLDEVEKRKAE